MINQILKKFVWSGVLLIGMLGALILGGCDSANSTSRAEESQSAKLLGMIDALEAMPQSTDSELLARFEGTQEQIDEARGLLMRSREVGYKLLSPMELKNELDSYIIIATMPRGIYNLGLIPNARHFEFSISPNVDESGKEVWALDAKSRPQEQFIRFLGENKSAKILFYDEGEHVFAPVGSAHIALLWAKALGYTNLYRLSGGLKAWKELGIPLSTQAPSCCQM